MAQDSGARHSDPPRMGVFFSPPENIPFDSFKMTPSPLRKPYDALPPVDDIVKLPSIHTILLSPPISPATGVVNHKRSPDNFDLHVRDPQLFLRRSQSASFTDTSSPLFRPLHDALLDSPEDVVIDLQMDIDPSPKRAHRQSTPTEELTLAFRPRIAGRFAVDPLRYIRQELEFLSTYGSYRSHRNDQSLRGVHKDPDPRQTRRQRAIRSNVTEKIPSIRRQARAAPREYSVDSMLIEKEYVPVKAKRRVSHSTPVTREDMDFKILPDYSPSIASMAPGKNLKVEWKGHPLDLGADPDHNLLDDAELYLASTLRLTCAQYLFAKRKIFERYIELAKLGRDFNKTSAQSVCKIDVNKASKLWTAFDKVGWFDRRHFVKYML